GHSSRQTAATTETDPPGPPGIPTTRKVVAYQPQRRQPAPPTDLPVTEKPLDAGITFLPWQLTLLEGSPEKAPSDPRRRRVSTRSTATQTDEQPLPQPVTTASVASQAGRPLRSPPRPSPPPEPISPLPRTPRKRPRTPGRLRKASKAKRLQLRELFGSDSSEE
ncbi:PREDICTED: leucine-rich repeat extensin-like protein 5, partial [Cyphomyrmex costatus]|uniref:leucine-rich repeat extensin-like protein 5 n=1 Tax=Cyphomyrmex costatus TaxID=456900 RepID=UPI00085232BE